MHESPALIRALLYARVSSPEQKRRRDSDQDEPSLGEQFAAMEREAERRGWVIVERCEDTVSGATPVRQRPGGSVIYDRAQRGAFDVLMVYDNDRVGRDKDALVARVFRADLRLLSKQVFSVYQPIEPAAPARYDPYENDSEFMTETFSDASSSLAIRQFCRRRDFGMRKRIQLKKLMAGKLPIGYTAERHVFPNGRAMLGPRHEDPVYGPIVRRIFALYEGGCSYQKVAVELNGEGLRTPAAKYWTAGTIHGIVANPVYYGAAVYLKHRSNGPPHPRRPGHRISRNQPPESWMIVDGGQHPPLVSQEQWQRVQAIRKSRRQGIGRTMGESTLLSGLVECGRCGAPMNRSGSWSGGYWVCSHARRTGGRECDRQHFRVLWVEAQTIAYLQSLVTDPTLLSKLSFRSDEADTEELDSELANIERRLGDLSRCLIRAREAYEAGIDSLGEFASRKAELEREGRPLTERRAGIKQLRGSGLTPDTEKSLAEMLAGFADNLRQHPLHRQKTVLRNVIDKVVVAPDRLHIRFNSALATSSECESVMKMIHSYSEDDGELRIT